MEQLSAQQRRSDYDLRESFVADLASHLPISAQDYIIDLIKSLLSPEQSTPVDFRSSVKKVP